MAAWVAGDMWFAGAAVGGATGVVGGWWFNRFAAKAACVGPLAAEIGFKKGHVTGIRIPKQWIWNIVKEHLMEIQGYVHGFGKQRQAMDSSSIQLNNTFRA